MIIFVMPEIEEKLPEPPKDSLSMEVKITEIPDDIESSIIVEAE